MKRWGQWAGAAACLGIATAASARADVDVGRAVYVERSADGVRALEPASTLRKGDRVVTVLDWRDRARRGPFTLQSAVPRTLAFQRAGHDRIEVSADGGRTWGQLGSLRIGNRLASPEDVTHLRLRVAGTPAGRLTYSAIVR